MTRIPPNMPSQDYLTYKIDAPMRNGSCDEADCGSYRFGWVTTVDESTELGQAQAHYIRRESKRKFTERIASEGMTEFTFEAGQQCFTKHKVRSGRDERYRVVGGDFRANPTGFVRHHANAADWVEDFAEHQIALDEMIKKG